MGNSFFALLARMRHIQRWGLMRNAFPSNLSEHSYLVAVIAHCLGAIRINVFGGTADVGVLTLEALYHDSSEIITGDLPTPIKYGTPELTAAYKTVETLAREKLLTLLPEELRPSFEPYITHEDELVSAADKLSAYIKCVEERLTGNTEFINAEQQLLEKLKVLDLPEVTYFIEHFMPDFGKTLDELTSKQ
jgi:5'-deoxynucleotidase